MIAFIWGSTFVLVKEALNDASPLALNSARMVVAAVLLAIFYRKILYRFAAFHNDITVDTFSLEFGYHTEYKAHKFFAPYCRFDPKKF